jgi:phospholipid transport system substrate-binding protein
MLIVTLLIMSETRTRKTAAHPRDDALITAEVKTKLEMDHTTLYQGETLTPGLGSLRWLVAGVSLLTVPLNAQAAESPQDTLRSTIDQVRAVLRDPASQGDAQRQERLAKVRELVLPQFAFPEMAKQALGAHWQNRTAVEQQEFVRLFTDLLEKIYSGTLERYATTVQVLFDHERLDGPVAEVDTRVLSSPHEQPVAITYRLHAVDGKWLINDVVIDQVSLVRNYRNQFSRILRTSSFADLMQDVEGTLQELDVAPLF